MTRADTADASAAFPEEQAVATTLPRPRITRRGVAVVVGMWLLYSALVAIPVVQDAGINYPSALIGQLAANTFLALYSLPVWWLIVRRMDRQHWLWIVAAHVVIGPLYAWLGIESFLAFVSLAFGPVAYREISAVYQWIFVGDLTAYAIQFALYHFIRSVQRLRLREQQAIELMALAREQELSALKAQIHPHFLFNTLNSISQAVKEHPEKTRDMIADLAGLLRYALDRAEHRRVPLRDEVRFAQAYLDLEAQRFSDRLRVRYDLDLGSPAMDTPVPPMLLQPLVENAVRHGIGPKEEGGTVTLRVAPHGGRLEVSVTDTGVGTASDPLAGEKSGLGLKNTNARLTHTFGPEAALHTAPNEPNGFKVWFSIPSENGRMGEWENGGTEKDLRSNDT